MKKNKKNNFLFGIFLIIILSISFLLDSYFFNFVDLIKNNLFNIFFEVITYLGEFFIVLIFLTILFLFKKKEKRNIPLLWICFFLLGGIVIVLKFLITRNRPFGLFLFFPLTNIIDYSFPSLHAAVVIFALIVLTKELPKQKLIWGFISLLIVFSRIYLKVHFLSDVVVGAILGFIAARIYLKNINLRVF